MSGKIFSGGALMVSARWTRNVSGRVAAIPTTAAIASTSTSTMPPTIIRNVFMTCSSGFCQIAGELVEGAGKTYLHRVVHAEPGLPLLVAGLERAATQSEGGAAVLLDERERVVHLWG